METDDGRRAPLNFPEMLLVSWVGREWTVPLGREQGAFTSREPNFGSLETVEGLPRALCSISEDQIPGGAHEALAFS